MSQLLLYGSFIGFILLMLLVDMKLFHAKGEKPSTRTSAMWVGVWVSLALAFGAGVLITKGGSSAAEYFSGYLIEYSLSVDNVFVFLVIFNYFKVPAAFQRKVLFLGILGAIVFRGIFIAVGAALLHRFEWVIYILGALLLFTAYRLLTGGADVEPEDNPILKLFRKRARLTTEYDGQKFFTVKDGVRYATPLLVVLLVIETTDIVFAVDSIPAIFAITKDPFIVLTSNVFAVLGLRALYFLLAGFMDRFKYLKYGLSLILAFVGVKMLLTEVWEPPVWLSLVVIVAVLTVTVVLSLVRTGAKPHDVDEISGLDER